MKALEQITVGAVLLMVTVMLICSFISKCS